MKTRKQYGTFEKYFSENESDLFAEYNACAEHRKGLYENPSFEDFCIGYWQSLA